MKRNKFSLSNYKLLSCNLGSLVPCGAFEVLPGDSVQQATNMLIRMSPMLAPVMHPLHARVHHWFVPYRLIWEDWEDFITGGPDGLDASTYPLITGTIAAGTLGDYLGLPIMAGAEEFSALPFRAYALIWNEWYRDQDLQTALTVDIGSGADTTTNVTLQNVCWEKDYFTSARPWEQKGPAITIPIGSQAPVTGIGVLPAATWASTDQTVNETDLDDVVYSDNLATATGGGIYVKGSASGTDKKPVIYADLTDASAITINSLREALALQRFEEARARYGSRYTEYLRYLGVRSSDARLQRPEYLGGGKQTVQFSEVLQTGVTTSGNAAGVGTLRGHGIGAMRSNRYRRFFEEHGIVLSLLSLKPRTMYTQGMERMWNRRTKEDFWQKELETIGQQEILNKEVYVDAASVDGVFGYQDRYDEYRRKESSVAGDFRTSLDFWHFAREFASEPALNATFVSSVPTDRVFAVTTDDTVYVMANHSIQARRMLSQTGRSFTF